MSNTETALVFGLDFTSAPSQRKPITRATCRFSDRRLRVSGLDGFANFDAFEAALREPGKWIAGIDFPFGQPRRLVKNLEWPLTWANYVQLLASMTMHEFVRTISEYCAPRPEGDRQHRRATDVTAGALSPMKLYFQPVGRMFFRGAPRLLASGATVLPFTGEASDHVIVEAYPKVVARRAVGHRSYKNDDITRQTPAQRDTRADIVGWIRSDGPPTDYGFSVDLHDQLADAAISDPSGDKLDAVLCAVQAAWAYTKRDHDYGIPTDCDRLEGWIVDPALLATGQGSR